MANDADDARLEAALSLREIAGGYLKSAEEADNPTIWEARLWLAAKLEKEAAALKRILPDISEAERAASAEYTAPTGELVVTAPIGLGRLYRRPPEAARLPANPGGAI
jgi:hypothetical protein